MAPHKRREMEIVFRKSQNPTLLRSPGRHMTVRMGNMGNDTDPRVEEAGASEVHMARRLTGPY